MAKITKEQLEELYKQELARKIEKQLKQREASRKYREKKNVRKK